MYDGHPYSALNVRCPSLIHPDLHWPSQRGVLFSRFKRQESNARNFGISQLIDSPLVNIALVQQYYSTLTEQVYNCRLIQALPVCERK